MPTKVGTARLTSDGCTKIDDPTMVPTTIAVACVSPIDRVSFPVTRQMLSGAGRVRRPDERGEKPTDSRSGRLVHRQNRGDRVDFRGGLVVAVPFHACETKRDAARIL